MEKQSIMGLIWGLVVILIGHQIFEEFKEADDTLFRMVTSKDEKMANGKFYPSRELHEALGLWSKKTKGTGIFRVVKVSLEPTDSVHTVTKSLK